MIKTEDLRKQFDGFWALDGVNLNTEKGSVYGLVGPNGAGKSTLIRHLTGVYRPDFGRVLIDNEEVWENADVKAKLADEFAAGFCDDAQTKETIHSIYEKYSYTCDTHTAVAVKVYNDYKSATGDTTKTVIASTASPYKFSAAVLEALEGKVSDIDEYDKVDKIAELSDIPVPSALADLRNKPERFNDVIDKADQKDYVLRTLSE